MTPEPPEPAPQPGGPTSRPAACASRRDAPNPSRAPRSSRSCRSRRPAWSPFPSPRAQRQADGDPTRGRSRGDPRPPRQPRSRRCRGLGSRTVWLHNLEDVRGWWLPEMTDLHEMRRQDDTLAPDGMQTGRTRVSAATHRRWPRRPAPSRPVSEPWHGRRRTFGWTLDVRRMLDGCHEVECRHVG
jgi:hypothetical protein